ncbi:MAG: hypothetical protein MRJ92_08050 [Nitrospira sp.]|nr:hypothetical protein [Nitrospira sp.]
MTRVIIGLMIVLCVLVGAGVLGILDSGATDVFLEATRPDFQKIPIGVFGFQNGGGPEWLGGRIEEVLKADLQRSLVFTLVDLPGIGVKAREVTTTDRAIFKQAAENGVSVLVWGKSGQKNVSKDSELLMDGFVYDSGSDEVVGGKRYVGSTSVVRLMAHRFADELVFRYTGEPGIARTKIVYVAEHGNARELFVMDYDGYEPKQITADGFLNLMPRWSPDRRFIVFTAYRSRNTQDIDILELATGKRWTLVSMRDEHYAGLVAGRQFLAFASSQTAFEIYKRYANQSLTAADRESGGRSLTLLVTHRSGTRVYLRSRRGAANLCHECRRLQRAPADVRRGLQCRPGLVAAR